MSAIGKLKRLGLLEGAPDWALEPEYEVIMGSMAYGVSGNSSDIDLYAVCVPQKEALFPHLNGMVPGFAPQPDPPHVWQRHHIKTEEGTKQEKEYDVASYSIVSFFRLAAENNPNIIDALFVPPRCIVNQSDIGKNMRENRRLFLHKGAFDKFKGYAYSQMKQIATRKPVGKRAELVEKFGYDVKFAYHVVRLANEAEQILRTGDLNLEANKEELKAIREGAWTLEYLQKWFEDRTLMLDKLRLDSKLRDKPDWVALNNVLLGCLETKFGSLSQAMVTDEGTKALQLVEQIRKLVTR